MLLGFAWYHYIGAILFAFVAIILMLVILLQRGRGVGLAGAFGGAGGYTAFGAKTGDFLTWATIVIAGILLLAAVILNYAFTGPEKDKPAAPPVKTAPAEPTPIQPTPIPSPLTTRPAAVTPPPASTSAPAAATSPTPADAPATAAATAPAEGGSLPPPASGTTGGER